MVDPLCEVGQSLQVLHPQDTPGPFQLTINDDGCSSCLKAGDGRTVHQLTFFPTPKYLTGLYSSEPQVTQSLATPGPFGTFVADGLLPG